MTMGLTGKEHHAFYNLLAGMEDIFVVDCIIFFCLVFLGSAFNIFKFSISL